MLGDPSLQEGVAALLHQSRKTTNKYASGDGSSPDSRGSRPTSIGAPHTPACFTVPPRQ